ncbi:hypothetical protein HDU76_007613, partial [Blyttiomyces sp. JEL0837]
SYRNTDSIYEKLKEQNKLGKQDEVPVKRKVVDFAQPIKDSCVIALTGKQQELTTYSEIEGGVGVPIVNDGRFMFIDDTRGNSHNSNYKSCKLLTTPDIRYLNTGT